MVKLTRLTPPPTKNCLNMFVTALLLNGLKPNSPQPDRLSGHLPLFDDLVGCLQE
jgi:hypothetical protein